MTKWTDERTAWVRALSDAQIVSLVAHITQHHAPLDENGGDRTETAEAILWLTTRGEYGNDWGIPVGAAEDLGLWHA